MVIYSDKDLLIRDGKSSASLINRPVIHDALTTLPPSAHPSATTSNYKPTPKSTSANTRSTPATSSSKSKTRN